MAVAASDILSPSKYASIILKRRGERLASSLSCGENTETVPHDAPFPTVPDRYYQAIQHLLGARPSRQDIARPRKESNDRRETVRDRARARAPQCERLRGSRQPIPTLRLHSLAA